MRHSLLACVASAALAITAAAQSTTKPNPEIRPFVGAYIPTGNQGDMFRSAVIAGLDGGIEISHYATLVGGFSYAYGRQKLPAYNDKVNTWTYDAGVELALSQANRESMLFRPFAGAGLGGRTYDYADASLTGKSFFVRYLSAGTELQVGRSALRLEARDYISDFEEPVAPHRTSTRNDLTIALGLAYHLW